MPPPSLLGEPPFILVLSVSLKRFITHSLGKSRWERFFFKIVGRSFLPLIVFPIRVGAISLDALHMEAGWLYV